MPKSIGVLGAKTETPVESDADHINVCKVSIKSRVYKACETLLKEVMAEAPKRIFEAVKPCETSFRIQSKSLLMATQIKRLQV